MITMPTTALKLFETSIELESVNFAAGGKNLNFVLSWQNCFAPLILRLHNHFFVGVDLFLNARPDFGRLRKSVEEALSVDNSVILLIDDKGSDSNEREQTQFQHR